MFYYILFKSLLTQPYFCRFHLDNYWNICIKNGFTPTLPTNWTPLRGWVPPMSMIPPNHKFFYGCRFLLLTFCQCISTHPAVHHKVWPESHKSSSYSSCYQEWDSGVSACDYHLVSLCLLFILDLLIKIFSPFGLLNALLFGNSSPT